MTAPRAIDEPVVTPLAGRIDPPRRRSDGGFVESLGYAAYGALGLALLPPGLLVAGAGAALRSRWRAGFLERLGRLPEGIERVRERPVRLWIHCASIGEVRAAHPLLSALASGRPDAGLLVTTTTPEGNRTARGLGIAHAVGMLPADLPGLPGRVFDAMEPDALVLLETELWPGLLRAAASRFVPALVVNGRISQRSFARYRRVLPLLRPVLDDVTAFAMQAEEDRERILALGADPARVQMHGNLKYDALALPQPAAPAVLAPLSQERVLVAGSTHEGEETAIADAFLALRAALPDLRLVVAPRHLQRAPAAQKALEALGLSVVRRSALVSPPKPGEVVLLDTTGELAGVYSLATAVFVGGSLIPRGGHNPLEALAHGRPVAFGPFTHNFRDVTAVVLESGGAKRVADASALTTVLRPWLENPDAARRDGAAARERILARHGAVSNAMDLLERWIGPPAPVLPERGPQGRVEGRASSPFRLTLRPRSPRTQDEPAQPVLQLAASAASCAYTAAVTLRRVLYDAHALPSSRAGVPTLSVGGIAAGGTGKTPAVIHLARLLASRGRHVAVVSRGYGGRPGPTPLVVSGGWSGRDPHHPQPGADRAGDEPLLIAAHAPEAAVFVHPDRVAAARAAVAHGADVILLDDGFQHRRLARDLDVVLLDARAPFGNGRLLPAGPLRDLPSRLRDAGLVLLTRADAAGPAATARATARVSLATEAPIIRFAHRISRFLRDDGSEVSAAALAAERPYGFCGLATPDAFFESVAAVGVRTAGEHPFPDHHPYDAEDVADLEAQAEAAGARTFLTTGKDRVRFPSSKLPVVVAELSFEPLSDDDARMLDTVLDRILSGY